VLNSVTEVHKNTIPLSIEEGNEEKLAAVLARDIFLSGPDEWHNCFYVGGNDATLDVGTAREVVPLLSEIIEEGERMGRRHDDAQHLFA
jgi:hypothetical protein